MVSPFQQLSIVTSVRGTCLFASITLAVKPATEARLPSAAAGCPISREELLRGGGGVIKMERIVDNVFGFGRKDDMLPGLFLNRLLVVAAKGRRWILQPRSIATGDYPAMGWDVASGLPMAETLDALGIGWMM